MKKTIIFLAAALAVMSLSGCVKDGITSISFVEKEVSIRPGDAVRLAVEVQPDGASVTALSWKSSNPDAVTVDDEGVVTGVAFGESVITASSASQSAGCTVIVTIPAENIGLAEKEMFLRVGDSHAFEVTVTPADAERDFVWTSSAPEYVTVSADGVATAVADGEAEITLTAARGTLSATCLVKSISYDSDDYVDEWGINHGKGIVIGGVTWAPVNCGYHETDYPYGKLYQWGRNEGQGYSDDGHYYPKDDATTPDLKMYIDLGEYPEDNVFYLTEIELCNGQWMYGPDGFAFDRTTDWNDLEKSERFKDYPGIGNPCPRGWRVPIYEELSSLKQGGMDYTSKYVRIEEDPTGQGGHWFGLNAATATHEDPQGCIWFCHPGSRHPSSGSSYNRAIAGEYWSATPYAGQYDGAYVLYMDPNYVTDYQFPYARAYGLPVRCIKE